MLDLLVVEVPEGEICESGGQRIVLQWLVKSAGENQLLQPTRESHPVRKRRVLSLPLQPVVKNALN